MMASKELPTGVKVISILYYIGAALGAIVGIMLFIGAGSLEILAQQNPALANFGPGFAVVMGIIFLALAVLGFFVGRGLWTVQHWARITSIILAVLGVVFAVISLIAGDFISIISLAVHAVIGGYLLFNPQVKSVFS